MGGPSALPANLRSKFSLFILVLTLTSPSPQADQPDTTRGNANAAITGRLSESYGQLPLSFERNLGQTDRQVEFLSRGSGYALFLSSGGEAVLSLASAAESPARNGAVLRLRVIGASKNARVEGLGRQAGKVNYLVGQDQTRWRTGIETYSRVAYRDLYPGIDLEYYGNQRQLEYDFIVQPGADPGMIALEADGADAVEIDTNGDLVLHVGALQVRQRKPAVYQHANGVRNTVDARYELHDGRRATFQIGAYDRRLPLVIDPVLVFSTYLGGAYGGDAIDRASDMVVDAAGNAYVTGQTIAADFPVTEGAYDSTLNGGLDAFVTKLDSGGMPVYSTVLGGSRTAGDEGLGIAVDAAGHAYVTGMTSSDDFPTTEGAYDRDWNGDADVFVTKLDAAGTSLVYSTFLGRTGRDIGQGIAVDWAGHAYVTGNTNSADFPTTPDAYDPTFGGGFSSDAFVVKLATDGSALVHSTFLGGAREDVGWAVAVDAAGNAYVAGATSSTDFPTTVGAYDTTLNNLAGTSDVFVTKLDAIDFQARYSTFVGGSSSDGGSAIAIGADGTAYVTGYTFSNTFPTTPGAYDTSINGGSDAIVIKLNATGDALLYSTYLGGTGTESGSGVAINAAGNAYVTGTSFFFGSSNNNFPTTAGAHDATFNGGAYDGFVTKLSAEGASLVYSTFLGGSGDDQPRAVAVDALDNAYVAGYTCSANFPTTPNAFDDFGNGCDGFVTKLNATDSAPLLYSTFLGGGQIAGGTDSGLAIAVDAEGAAYLTGYTNALDFPTTAGAYDSEWNAGRDVFVSKLNSTGTDLVYSTYLGGSGDEEGWRIAVDAVGSAYITGYTLSYNFPTTAGAYDTTWSGTSDAFVARLDPTGAALVYATLLGGSSPDFGRGIAVDAEGHAYVAGETSSVDFPTTAGAFDASHNGGSDVFVTKLAPNGGALIYSTLVGGGNLDAGIVVAVDAVENAYVVGSTNSPNFPTTAGAYDRILNGMFGNGDAFVLKLDASGGGLAYSTFLGGGNGESGQGLALDTAGNAYVTGVTFSSDFPTTPGAYDRTWNSDSDMFVAKLDPIESGLIYSTYLGGNSADSAGGLAVDSDGHAYLTGYTFSNNYPVTFGPGRNINTYDAFVTKFDPAGAALVYSTFLGGTRDDRGQGIAVDAYGDAYVTGLTFSANFPTTSGAYDTTYNSTNFADVFVSKIGVGPPATLELSPTAAVNTVDEEHCVTAQVRDAIGQPVRPVIVRFTVTGAVDTSGSRTTDTNGQARFCYQGSPMAGTDSIAAYADTNGNGSQDTGEPDGTASKSWVLPTPAPACGQVDGKGLIAVTGGEARFDVKVGQDRGDVAPEGKVKYSDPAGIEFSATTITHLIISGTHATIHGSGRKGDGSVVPFRVDVTDGDPDTFRILWPGYAAEGPVTDKQGIEIEHECKDKDKEGG